VRRVGDTTPVFVDVRVLAATNEPLEERIAAGQFREDLYYRLNVISIALPPLRERQEDIPLLISHFLKSKCHARTGRPFRITCQVMEAFHLHAWPGNVRELENAIERACALSESPVMGLADFPPALQRYADRVTANTEIEPQVNDHTALAGADAARQPMDGAENLSAKPIGTQLAATLPAESLRTFLREQEGAYINRVMAQTGGDKEKTAAMLGISLATLYRKLAEEDAC
jgi:DNA-binding NtrC family response regulator